MIKSLQSEYTYIPVPENEITKQMKQHKDFNLRLNLSDKIVNLIGEWGPPSTSWDSGDLESTQQKQIFITVDMALSYAAFSS